MRSRAARVTLAAAAWMAIGAAAYLVLISERQIAEERTAVRAFDARAGEAAEALADLRAAQQAYVAAGQAPELWMSKVPALVDAVSAAVDTLRASAASTGARSVLMEAAATVSEFNNADRRAREYLRTGEQLMAADVVYREGGEAALLAARRLAAARLAESRELDAFEAAVRGRQRYALAGAAAVGAWVLAMLAFVPARAPEAADAADDEPLNNGASRAVTLTLRDRAGAASAWQSDPGDPVWHEELRSLKAAAELCTEFGRVNDAAELDRLLGRAADLMDASGLIVWLGNVDHGDLRPVLTHGYSAKAVARLPAISRAADNAAAAAYRTGTLQVVLAPPGGLTGAIVAPLLSAAGCIGALSAELKDGRETSETVQGLAAIFAAQLSAIVAGSTPATATSPPSGGRIASA